MKGIILAGGTGSRLSPLTDVTNKSLLPVYDKPLICYPLETMIDSGVTEFCVVARSCHSRQFVEFLGNGESYGVNIDYRFQSKPGGIADALGLCRQWADDRDVVVMLGDTILEKPFPERVTQFDASDGGAAVFVTRLDDPSWCGVVRYENETPVEIVEKATKPPSNDVVIGLYFYDYKVWDIIDSISPSARGELEITSVNNVYLRELNELKVFPLDGWWHDAGTDFEALFEANRRVREKRLKNA